jgi:hypothetical protein
VRWNARATFGSSLLARLIASLRAAGVKALSGEAPLTRAFAGAAVAGLVAEKAVAGAPSPATASAAATPAVIAALVARDMR